MSTRQACATGGQTERDRWFRDQTPPERTQPMKALDDIEARWIRTTNEGVDSDHWALRPNIAAALGIEVEG